MNSSTGALPARPSAAPGQGPRRRVRTLLAALAASVALIAQTGEVLASCFIGGGIVRDAEAETLIREYARPIFQAAGIDNS